MRESPGQGDINAQLQACLAYRGGVHAREAAGDEKPSLRAALELSIGCTNKVAARHGRCIVWSGRLCKVVGGCNSASNWQRCPASCPYNVIPLQCRSGEHAMWMEGDQLAASSLIVLSLLFRPQPSSPFISHPPKSRIFFFWSILLSRSPCQRLLVTR